MSGRTGNISGQPHVKGAARDTMRAEIAELYNGNAGNKGLSVRSIAEKLEKSYGFVHHMLREAMEQGLVGQMRDRGGNNHKAKTPPTTNQNAA